MAILFTIHLGRTGCGYANITKGGVKNGLDIKTALLSLLIAPVKIFHISKIYVYNLPFESSYIPVYYYY